MTETLRSQRPQPCNGCPDRYRACSDSCTKEEYLKWRQEQELIKKNRKAYRNPAWFHGEQDPGNYRKHKKFR